MSTALKLNQMLAFSINKYFSRKGDGKKTCLLWNLMHIGEEKCVLSMLQFTSVKYFKSTTCPETGDCQVLTEMATSASIVTEV